MASAIVLVEARGVHVNNESKGGEINEIVKRYLSTKPPEKTKINQKTNYFIDNAASNPKM
jgi:hypothetical protein